MPGTGVFSTVWVDHRPVARDRDRIELRVPAWDVAVPVTDSDLRRVQVLEQRLRVFPRRAEGIAKHGQRELAARPRELERLGPQPLEGLPRVVDVRGGTHRLASRDQTIEPRDGVPPIDPHALGERARRGRLGIARLKKGQQESLAVVERPSALGLCRSFAPGALHRLRLGSAAVLLGEDRVEATLLDREQTVVGA
jgi:hypothetical protein